MYNTKDLELLGESYEAVYKEEYSGSEMYALENCIDYEGCTLIAICPSMEDAIAYGKEYMEEYRISSADQLTITKIPGFNHRIDELPASASVSLRELI